MQVPVYTYRAIPGGFQILADGVLCHHQPFQAGVPGFQPYPDEASAQAAAEALISALQVPPLGEGT
ncbi:hypothetical protein IS481_14785 [Caldimonas thermodepolymerans]|uniref:Uncharacterized protein n=1 Tax=Caldimonas thermodepolymerans TaxID=215580 RepID=A0A2S5T3M4_9BURK|nr:hypothetical protein [Caldimonas thermodepolymerans]PPE69498.1 hypothetical protein C1702_11180 [Caldimonas thermodepolymerans]QPC30988.1 hypothetical protein IS481_14785 [Caldimonas thermodepolymerans]RDH96998.1 hypothetical protein DES46_10913 [Caldimonas thermodepolymerans]